MSETTPERPAVLGRRGEAECARARTSLAEGRHADALAAVRRARRLRPAQEAPALALAEADALLGLLRYREAVVVATRALRRGLEHDDVEARLRVVRGHGLWLTGPASRAYGEVRKAAQHAKAPLTRARVLEAQGLFAWKSNDREAALAHLAQAEEIYRASDCTLGTLRVLEKHATVLRGEGRLEEALAVQQRRVEVAAGLRRSDVLALARSGRAGLLAALGRWEEARREYDESAALFREKGDAREFTVAEAGRAAVDVATGDLGRARGALERARDLHAERGNTRSLAETLLRVSDLHLASGEAAVAERIAVEALGLYRLLQDTDGECRSRVRRVHALVTLRRFTEAVREGRRASRAASSSRGDLEAFALLALGRALLRVDRREAGAVFERARAVAQGRPGYVQAADLGIAGARGMDPDGHEVRQALAGLEAWGDRRVLAYALADVREILGRRAASLVAEGALAALPRVPVLSAAVDAAAAVVTEPAPVARWAAVMRALGTVLPWRRAVLVADSAWELAREGVEPRPLAEHDMARSVARESTGPRVVDVSRDGWEWEPSRVLHGLTGALVAPMAAGAAVYLDFRAADGPPPDETGLALLAEFVRLLGLRPIELLAPEDAAVIEDVPGIIGRCPAMRTTLRTMARVAPSDLVVHVTGETGTGKERVAEALHERSGRPGRFVAVNASSLSDELFESELFGHVRGAFTGAVADREGQVAAAERGTLFLDEVADLSPRAQAKLLRFVETREYARVGETRLRKADVRLVTAANTPLESRLRPDLIFRLKDVVLALPPLRARGDDLWRLVRAFLRQYAPAGRSEPILSAAARRLLESYSWPGNVRELQREIHRAVVMCNGAAIGPEHLSLPADGPRSASRSLQDAVRACERQHIAEVLGEHGGNRARAAVALGLTRQGLVAKIARLGIG
ncbi:MAG TPA: sigma 54-interacting transcriptional regulator [Vicinamibacteria bacterium]|nr:sigma 54-interacting transcriptional regulator [Vicinamibacteria bacterium]